MAQTPRIRVGIVTDGPPEQNVFPIAAIEREVANVAGNDFAIVFPEDKRFAADWSLESVDLALNRALGDPEVDVVVTLGVLASHQAAHRTALPKPTIAPAVIDPVLQGFPVAEGASGLGNFAYVANFASVENEVRTFQQITGFKHLVALIDASLLRALPQLSTKADELARSLDVRITLVQAINDAQAALAAIPADADAVYVTGLLQFEQEDLRELARGLVAKRLPSFSVIGRSEVEAGLLMTTGGAQRDFERLSRRIVLMIQRVAEGEDPARFDVSFPTVPRLAINMQTARAIGFSPRWQFLTDAEQLNAESAGDRSPLTLLDALRAALDLNPALAASRERAESTGDDVRISRSELLPSLDASAGRTRIDVDRASPLTQAENTTSAGLSFQQVIYSERAWAAYSISQSLYEAAKQGQRQDMLDTLDAAASAYFSLLRTKSIESVRRTNVENTRKNLETSRVREAVGLGGRSDYLRWVAQLATDRQNLLAAESARRQAETELSRQIHRPASEPFSTVETGLDDPLALISNARTQAFLDTPDKWSVFMDYVVHSALEKAPEIAQANAVIASRQRAVTAARRAYFVPALAIVSNGSRTYGRSGAGSAYVAGAPDDESWSISVQASIPVFTGRQRAAELSQARHELKASEADRLSATDSVESRARMMLHRTASSYPSIELSGEAAAAADQNLAMVTDAYARGAVSVTDLIDAQDAALSAGLAVADAKYTFLTDFVSVLRAMSEFEILLDPWSREAWLQRVDEWFRTRAPAFRP